MSHIKDQAIQSYSEAFTDVGPRTDSRRSKKLKLEKVYFRGRNKEIDYLVNDYHIQDPEALRKKEALEEAQLNHFKLNPKSITTPSNTKSQMRRTFYNDKRSTVFSPPSMVCKSINFREDNSLSMQA